MVCRYFSVVSCGPVIQKYYFYLKGVIVQTVTGLALVLQYIGSIVTSAISWLTSYIGVITASGNELLLLFVCIPLVGLGVGLLRRMISL